MTNVQGKWALITGASRGIGYLSAIYLAKKGCNLVLHSRDKKNSQKIYDEVIALGVKAYQVAGELSDMNQVKALLTELDQQPFSIDIVLNNAAVQIAYRTDYYNTPVSDFTESFMINTIVPAMICYHYLPKMIEKGFGRIVNTTSGIRLEPEQAGYSASKAALDKITVDMGLNIDGSDVMISLTDPGWCTTDLGGPKAPNTPESALPGTLLGVFLDDKKSGRCFSAQEFAGIDLEAALEKAQKETTDIYSSK